MSQHGSRLEMQTCDYRQPGLNPKPSWENLVGEGECKRLSASSTIEPMSKTFLPTNCLLLMANNRWVLPFSAHPTNECVLACGYVVGYDNKPLTSSSIRVNPCCIFFYRFFILSASLFLIYSFYRRVLKSIERTVMKFGEDCITK